MTSYDTNDNVLLAVRHSLFLKKFPKKSVQAHVPEIPKKILRGELPRDPQKIIFVELENSYPNFGARVSLKKEVHPFRN